MSIVWSRHFRRGASKASGLTSSCPYQCPADHPYLLNHDNAPPFGTAIPNGVVVENLGPVGVSIPVRTNAGKYALGTRLGSATNWTLDPQSYRVLLQCTSDIKHGWKFGSGTDL